VLEEARQGARREDGVGLLIASRDAVDEGVGDGRDVFAMVAEGRESELDGRQPKGEVREKEVLTGELAQGGMGGGEEKEAGGGVALEEFEKAEQQVLACRGEQVDAVEVERSLERRDFAVGGEPGACVRAAERQVGEGGLAVRSLAEEMLASAGFSLEERDMGVGCNHPGLEQEAAQSGTDADERFGEASSRVFFHGQVLLLKGGSVASRDRGA
jgi:hypothetical protein